MAMAYSLSFVFGPRSTRNDLVTSKFVCLELKTGASLVALLQSATASGTGSTSDRLQIELDDFESNSS